MKRTSETAECPYCGRDIRITDKNRLFVSHKDDQLGGYCRGVGSEAPMLNQTRRAEQLLTGQGS